MAKVIITESQKGETPSPGTAGRGKGFGSGAAGRVRPDGGG